MNTDRTCGALNTVFNLLYLNPVSNFGHLVKLAKTALLEDNDPLVHFIDQVLNSQTVNNLEDLKEELTNITSAQSCLLAILQTLDKSLGKLHNTIMNSFINKSFKVIGEKRSFDKCTLCGRIPDAIPLGSEIPMIEVDSEDSIDLTQCIADWFQNRFHNKKSSPLTCYCTTEGTNVRASWMVKNIPQQLLIGLKRLCRVKDVHKRVSLLNQIFLAKSIIHETPLIETVLSVCRTTGWLKVTEDGTVVKYLPDEISGTGKKN